MTNTIEFIWSPTHNQRPSAKTPAMIVKVRALLDDTGKDEVLLGVGEVAGGPVAAAIGNAVSHALGTRIRDLPLTRERIMASLLKE